MARRRSSAASPVGRQLRVPASAATTVGGPWPSPGSSFTRRRSMRYVGTAIGLPAAARICVWSARALVAARRRRRAWRRGAGARPPRSRGRRRGCARSRVRSARLSCEATPFDVRDRHLRAGAPRRQRGGASPSRSTAPGCRRATSSPAKPAAPRRQRRARARRRGQRDAGRPRAPTQRSARAAGVRRRRSRARRAARPCSRTRSAAARSAAPRAARRATA